MKKFKMIILMVLMIAVMAIPVSAKTKKINAKVFNHYTEFHIQKSGIIKKYPSVRFISSDGNIWGWRLEKGQKFHRGQKVTLFMDVTNKNIFRWKIKKVKIRG